MTDAEFDVLDELYFVVAYSDLSAAVGMPDRELAETLIALYKKEWIKCLEGTDKEVHPIADELIAKASDFHFLATKAGLLAHNGR